MTLKFSKVQTCIFSEEGLKYKKFGRRVVSVAHWDERELLGLIRDGNGYPRPDTRWVFTPLGYVYGLNILPVGLLLGKNLHPMGKRVLERSAFTHTH
jgi:hypothetical protein